MNTVSTHCEQGELAGRIADGVISFLDVPYARDGGRFADALPPQGWSGIRDATRPGPVFPQLPSRLDFVMGPTARNVEMSEDAFRLNVYTPSLEGRLPVIFWIHGGGFLTGGALRCYSGNQLARSGRAVVVTFNYRLGVFGNLYLPGTSRGNQSVRDIVAALHWVKRNIERFGGDPDSIVLAGQSAGAWYSQLLMSMTETSGLVRSAVLLSWPGLPPQTPEVAHSVAREFCAIGSFDGPPGDLRNASVPSLLETQAKLLGSRAAFGAIPVGFMPVSDEHVPSAPMKRAAQFAPKPVMISWTRDETGSFFGSNPLLVDATRDAVLARFRQEFGTEGDSQYARSSNRRLGSTPYSSLVELTSYGIFKGPALEAASLLADAGSATYTFEFGVPSHQPHVGAGHCFELPFVFGNFPDWPEAPMLHGINQRFADQLSELTQAYLLNFVETGNPNGDNLPEWKAFRRGEQASLHLSETVTCYPATQEFATP
ncbi:carboxylesterase/lipase family protein [Pandoraea soli]|uniref:Carboxylic ester hydrolase n=1 Tax=Pandoraea soli TaxID=2508293 RepID=A0ABY6W153_9BURK|nr:carboxylesterase family protein [Pandoraea soli]VVE10800.1 Phenmedipham hydrolase [Pandoraea soli]